MSFTTFPLFQMEDISDSEIVFGLQAIVFHKVALDHIGRRLRPHELREVVKQFEEWICWWDAILDSIDEVTLPHV